MQQSLGTMVLVPVAVLAAPLLTERLRRRLLIPVVAFEVLFGILIGPSALSWATEDDLISGLSQLGLTALFFMAGYEIEFALIRGTPLRRALLGYIWSLATALIAGLLIGSTFAAGVFIAISLTSTALGTLLPVLRDSNDTRTPFGTAVLAIGAVGEFCPIIAITLFLSGRNPGTAALVLAGFVLLATVAVVVALRKDHLALHGLIDASLRSSAQIGVRLVMLVLAGMSALALALGVDVLLGAFTAGIIFRLVMGGAQEELREALLSKMEAVAFGFLVPIFFVNSGLTFDLKALTDDLPSMALVPLFLVLFLVVRGVPSYAAAPPGSSRGDRRSLALYGSTALPIVVAVTTIGTESGRLPTGVGAALVAAGMLSVLLFPFLALRMRQQSAEADAVAGSVSS
jgi:Kef-type K+ transport system membrane component KefB